MPAVTDAAQRAQLRSEIQWVTYEYIQMLKIIHLSFSYKLSTCWSCHKEPLGQPWVHVPQMCE